MPVRSISVAERTDSLPPRAVMPVWLWLMPVVAWACRSPWSFHRPRRREPENCSLHSAPSWSYTSWHEANALAVSMARERDAFLHPFDDPLLWEGHATLVDEVACGGLKPDAIVLSVGGGGLLCGVVEGLRRNDWSNVPVIAVETSGADSYAQAVQAKRRVVLPAISSIASSLGARQVCQRAFDLAMCHPIRNVVVSDAEAIAACMRFVDDHRLVVEPACGASLAVTYGSSAALRDYETVLVVVCGGVTATLQQLQIWHRQLCAQ